MSTILVEEQGPSWWQGTYTEGELQVIVHGYNQFYTLYLLIERLYKELGITEFIAKPMPTPSVCEVLNQEELHVSKSGGV